MSEVDKLLTAALIEMDAVDPAHRDAQFCLRQYFADLDGRFDSGFDPARSLPTEADDMRPPRGVFLVEKSAGRPPLSNPEVTR